MPPHVLRAAEYVQRSRVCVCVLCMCVCVRACVRILKRVSVRKREEGGMLLCVNLLRSHTHTHTHILQKWEDVPRGSTVGSVYTPSHSHHTVSPAQNSFSSPLERCQPPIFAVPRTNKIKYAQEPTGFCSSHAVAGCRGAEHREGEGARACAGDREGLGDAAHPAPVCCQ